MRSVTAAAYARAVSGSWLPYTSRSIVPSVENPAASARMAQSRMSPPSVPGTVFGRPIPIFIRLPWSMVCDVGALGLERKPLARPALDPAAEVIRVPPGGAECLHGHRGSHSHPALEHDRAVGRDRVCARCKPLELDVRRTGDPARLPLVRLAHVDQEDVALVECLLHLCRRQLV